MLNLLISVLSAVAGFMLSRTVWAGWEHAKRLCVLQAYERHRMELGAGDGPALALPATSRALYGVLHIPPYYYRDFDVAVQKFYHDNEVEFMMTYLAKKAEEAAGNGDGREYL